MKAIELNAVVKTFGRTRALDGLDLEVRAGEVHGLLGPNGAGKSTIIRILLGLLHHDAGEVRLLGADPWADAVRLHRRLRAELDRTFPLTDVYRHPTVRSFAEAMGTDTFAAVIEDSKDRASRRRESLERRRARR